MAGIWMTTSEAAEHLGISVSTLYRMEKRGQVSPIRTAGGQRRFSKEELDTYLLASEERRSPCNPREYIQPDEEPPAVKDACAPLLFEMEDNVDGLIAALKSKEFAGTGASAQQYDLGKSVRDWLDQWDFRKSNTKLYTHGFHTYPAMFIPQVARKILLEFSGERQHVLDPFCGSGTTLVESRLLNRHATGVELNPLAVLIAEVKTTAIETERLLEALSNVLQRYSENGDGNVSLPDFKNRSFWFSKKISAEIARILEAISRCPDEPIQKFFKVCLSEIIREVSFTRYGEFKLFRDPRKISGDFFPDVLHKFFQKSIENIRGMAEFADAVGKGDSTTVKVIHGDARKQHMPASSVDLILTSPPYGDSRTTVAYGQFSRLPAQWFGLPDRYTTKLDSLLLGGGKNNRQKKNLFARSQTLESIYYCIREKDEKRSAEVLSFYSDFLKCMQWLATALRPLGHMVFVVGNRTVKGIVIRMDTIILEIAETLGLNPKALLYRNIPNKRMPSKNSPTNIKGAKSKTMTRESIVILQRPA